MNDQNMSSRDQVGGNEETRPINPGNLLLLLFRMCQMCFVIFLCCSPLLLWSSRGRLGSSVLLVIFNLFFCHVMVGLMLVIVVATLSCLLSSFFLGVLLGSSYEARENFVVYLQSER